MNYFFIKRKSKMVMMDIGGTFFATVFWGNDGMNPP